MLSLQAQFEAARERLRELERTSRERLQVEEILRLELDISILRSRVRALYWLWQWDAGARYEEHRRV